MAVILSISPGIDFHIGLNSSEVYRVARVGMPRIVDLLAEMWHDPMALIQVFNYVTANKVRSAVEFCDSGRACILYTMPPTVHSPPPLCPRLHTTLFGRVWSSSLVQYESK